MVPGRKLGKLWTLKVVKVGALALVNSNDNALRLTSNKTKLFIVSVFISPIFEI